MEATEKTLYVFLSLTRGNWRNAAVISCGNCPYEQSCAGFLLTADTEGTPVLLPVAKFEKMTGKTVDQTECAAVIRREAFESVYDRWLLWHVTDKNQCALRQITNTLQETV